MVKQSDTKNILTTSSQFVDEQKQLSCFHQVFEDIVSKYPYRTAIQCEDKSISYYDLNHLSDVLAKKILSIFPEQEKFVGVVMERSIEFVVAILAIIKTGNAYVPIDFDTLNPGRKGFPKERLSFMLKDTNMSLIVSQKKYSNLLPKEDKKIINIEDLDEKSVDVGLSLNITSDNMMYGIYTSGSTGYPKLTVVNHSSVMNLFYNIDKYIIGNENEYKVSLNAPFGFDASVQQLLFLLKGCCINIIPSKIRNSANQFIQHIIDSKIEILDCTPSQLQLLLSEQILQKCNDVLKIILVGGEAIPFDMWNELISVKNIKIYNVYGPTECTVDVTYCLVNDVNAKKHPNIGHAFDNIKIYIFDETMKEVPCGSIGEIYISGACLSRGYHNRPKLNENHFVFVDSICMYRTGDLGRWNEDGSIEYLGRLDEQVKIRSHRIELFEISNVLKKNKKVKDAVVSVAMENDYKVLIAYIKMNSGQKLNANELSEFMSNYVPEYMIPNYYIEVSKWPLSSNGKIDKKQLNILFQKRSEKKIDTPPSTKMEIELAEIVKKILNIRNVGINNSFMELGGDSLRVMTLLAEVYRTFDVEVDFSEFFREPTIKNLVEIINRTK